ncbi:MAG: indoleamine 2,3-dioxygenase [Gammaproteobacteria bacterium]|nr:indoleamine 2,3-dioxygenase [Gammaproteobacteria bacterium]
MNSVNSCPQHADIHSRLVKNAEILRPGYAVNGFLPEPDPLTEFPEQSPYHCLDQIGRDLPSLLCDQNFRHYANNLEIPKWQGSASIDELPSLRLYYLRLGFLASAYINQVNAPACHALPANICIPLVHACQLLQRPPILSYDGYALYNWRRFQKQHPIELGNIDTIQNFVHLYDEHWFILIHVEIEAIAADILAAISSIYRMLLDHSNSCIDSQLAQIAEAVERQVHVLKRIPEHMNPELYFKTFRPYIRFFERVVYQGVRHQAMDFRGETGAQSSIMPLLVAFLKIPHQSSILTRHLFDMRQYMPARHRLLIEQIEVMPSVRLPEYRDSFNSILDQIVEFRTVHMSWAHDYIHKHVKDPRGTGGTPYLQWLDQLLKETEAYKL